MTTRKNKKKVRKLQYKMQKEEKSKVRERTPNSIYSGRLKLQNIFWMKEKADHVKVVAWWPGLRGLRGSRGT